MNSCKIENPNIPAGFLTYFPMIQLVVTLQPDLKRLIGNRGHLTLTCF